MPIPKQPRNNESENAHQIDFRTFYYTLRERLWVIVLCLVVAGAGTAAYLVQAGL